MDIKTVVNSQYQAALAMLQQAVEQCPDSMWDDRDDENRFWRVAYHSLFFTHLYLQKTLDDFHPWEKHWEDAESMGKDAAPGKPYSKDEVLEYLNFCRKQVEERSAALNPDAPSGFHWLPFDKLELQFYSIRHLQQHTGELMERLGSRAGINVHWVSRGE
ncbi:MAG: DinB family protein [Omnitrophica WOR_2 bacterium]